MNMVERRKLFQAQLRQDSVERNVKELREELLEEIKKLSSRILKIEHWMDREKREKETAARIRQYRKREIER